MRKIRFVAISLSWMGLLWPSAQASAQAQDPFMSLPLVVDLKKTEVGSYADYALSGSGMTQRWAIVARDEQLAVLETTTSGSYFAKPLVVRMSIPVDPTVTARSAGPTVIQIGDDPPMVAPPEFSEPRFQKPNRKNLIGKEKIKVAAGTFQVSHYRESHAMGTVDVWISDKVPPLGLVKAINTPKGGGQAASGDIVTLELRGMGKGQRAVITKPPKAFDPGAIQGIVKDPTNRPR